MWNLLSVGGAFVLAGVLLLVPGYLTSRLVLPDASGQGGGQEDQMPPAARLLVALAWGCGMIPTFAFFLHLFLGWTVTSWSLTLVSAINTVVASFFMLRRHREGGIADRLFSWRRLMCHMRESRLVLVGAVAVGCGYLLKFDNTGPAEWSCLHETAFIAAGFRHGADLLRENVGDARLGTTGVIAAFLALFGGFGLRVLYALCGTLLALGGWVVGVAVGGRQAWGLVGLIFLPLNFYVAFIPRLDENLLTLAFSGAVLPFVAWSSARSAFGGALFGLAVAMRHVMLPSILAVLLALRGSPRPWRAIAAFLGAFVVVTLPENIHHHLALGSVFRFEHHTQFPPFPYEFLGIPFHWRGEMNWPFLDHVTRTPHNPFPNFVLWPLLVADHLGLVVWALMITGFFAIWRLSRRTALFWAAWSLPIIAGLAVQESWDYANKSAVIVIVFGAVTAWVVAGAAFVTARPVVATPVLLALVFGSWWGIGAIRDWRVPADERYYYANPKATEEDPVRVEQAARRLTDIAPWPDFGRLSTYGPFLASNKVTELGSDLLAYRDLTRYPWGWYPREAQLTSGGPVTLRLDLTERPDGRSDLVARSSAEPLLDLARNPGVHIVRGIRVPWDGRPLTLLAKAGPRNTALALSFDDPPRPRLPPGCPGCSVEGVRVDLLHAMLGTEIEAGYASVQNHGSTTLDIRVPSGAVSLALFWNLGGARGYLWKILASEDGVSVRPPFELWHN